MKNRGSAHLIIIVIASLVIIGAVGFVFWQRTQNTVDNAKQSSDSTKITNPETKVSTENQQINDNGDDTPNSNTVEYVDTIHNDVDLKERRLIVNGQGFKTDTGIQISLPDWDGNGTMPGGISLKSPEYFRDDNYIVQRGASIGIYYNLTFGLSDLTDSESDLQKLASASMTYPNISTTENFEHSFITVNGVKAIKFSDGKTIIFINNGNSVEIDISHNISHDNPYPNLIDKIANTVRFVEEPKDINY